jgi:hypothetical protein
VFDIKGAFLNAQFGPNDPRTFIKIRKELVPLWLEMDPTAAPFVHHTGCLIFELDKFIYGLKQAPAKFQAHLTASLVSIGYTQCTQDECFYTKHINGHFSIFSVHVDDILQVTTNRHLYDELKEELTKIYGEVTAHPAAKSYLGMSLQRSKCGTYIRIAQDGLVAKVIVQYPPSNPDTMCNSPATDELCPPPSEKKPKEMVDRKVYFGIVMTLMYIARPSCDIPSLAITHGHHSRHATRTKNRKISRKNNTHRHHPPL